MNYQQSQQYQTNVIAITTPALQSYRGFLLQKEILNTIDMMVTAFSINLDVPERLNCGWLGICFSALNLLNESYSIFKLRQYLRNAVLVVFMNAFRLRSKSRIWQRTDCIKTRLFVGLSVANRIFCEYHLITVLETVADLNTMTIYWA